MPIYQYQCEFGHTFEEHQSIKEYKLGQTKVCSSCGNEMERVIGEPILVTCDNGPTTIGQLGERNFKKLGKVRGQEKLAEAGERKKLAQNELCKANGVDPASVPDYKKMRRLSNLNKDQQRRYIETGKLPPPKPRTNNW